MTTNPITGNIPSAGSFPNPSTTPAASKTVSQDEFLTLLVAQLKNQDPMSPADGTAFVTQLATFSGVEQSTQMRDDLDAIKTALTTPVPSTTPPATTAASDTTGTTKS